MRATHVYDCVLSCAPCYRSCTTGEGIIAAAKKALQHAADSGTKPSKRSQAHNSDWVPALPAAQQALLSVLVHTQGAEAAGQLLLRQHAEQQQGQPQGKSGAAAAGRKGRAAASTGGSARQADGTSSGQGSGLLSLPVVDSFLTAAVSVVRSQQQNRLEAKAEAEAEAAVQVATELFKQHLVALSMGTAAPAAAAAGVLVPGATTWACLAELYGALGSWQQTASIVLAAAKQQLPGVSGPISLQVVLAGAAGAYNAAGKHVPAVQLLDGLLAAGGTAVALPGLAAQLDAAANADDTAFQVSGGTGGCRAAVHVGNEPGRPFTGLALSCK